MKHLLVFMSLFTIACTLEPLRQYNTEDHEDPACFAHFGAQQGYCWAKKAEL